jgi:hypothetical protein
MQSGSYYIIIIWIQSELLAEMDSFLAHLTMQSDGLARKSMKRDAFAWLRAGVAVGQG